MFVTINLIDSEIIVKQPYIIMHIKTAREVAWNIKSKYFQSNQVWHFNNTLNPWSKTHNEESKNKKNPIAFPL